MPEESKITAKKNLLLIFTLLLLALVVFLFYLDFIRSYKREELTFVMLDIGQGDSLFIESPTGTQILFDSGPPHKILGQLAKVMPPFDKTIDAIILSHPDQDHVGGFADVLKNYKVGQVFEPGVLSDSKTYENIENEIKKQNIPDIIVRKEMVLDLGGGVIMEILYPDRDVTNLETNDASIVAKLSYGATSVMLTGDAPIKTEQILLSEYSKEYLHSTVLKVGHHGSRTSSSNAFVETVSPEYALVSDGKDNKYGHPHQETLDTLEKYGAKIYRTDLLGMIMMKSDGFLPKFSFQK